MTRTRRTRLDLTIAGMVAGVNAVRESIVLRCARRLWPLQRHRAMFDRSPAAMRDIGYPGFPEAQQQEMLRMYSMGMLAAGVAHDLNNMLTAVAVHAELLLDEVAAGTQAHQSVQEIRSGVTRATGLAREFLRLGDGPRSHTAAVDLNDIVGQLRTMLQRLMPRDVRIICDAAKDLAPILAEPTHIEQVLLNLVVNARDAMPNGGEIRISTANVDVERGAAETREGNTRPRLKPGRYVQLRIEDNGHGMAADVQARIFEPFFTTKMRGGGTGLGLSTVYGIVKHASGFINVTSVVGRGTTFEVLWPAVR